MVDNDDEDRRDNTDSHYYNASSKELEDCEEHQLVMIPGDISEHTSHANPASDSQSSKIDESFSSQHEPPYLQDDIPDDDQQLNETFEYLVLLKIDQIREQAKRLIKDARMDDHMALIREMIKKTE